MMRSLCIVYLAVEQAGAAVCEREEGQGAGVTCDVSFAGLESQHERLPPRRSMHPNTTAPRMHSDACLTWLK
jgi:hypothetical protein